MSLRCENCRSLFFKTLETRVLENQALLLYKKRCKRCKYKYLLKKELPSGQISAVTLAEWQAGRKVNMAGSKIADRARIFVSEYTSRVSHSADDQLSYLRKVKHAEGVCHEWQKANG